MSSLVSLKTRLNSVASTQQVVKALELIASSKIKKAREKADAVSFFSDVIARSMKDTNGYKQIEDIKKSVENGTDVVIVITSDLGLAGAYNTQVIKEYNKVVKDLPKCETIVLGLKGYGKLSFEKVSIAKKIVNYSSQDEMEITEEILDYIIPLWEEKKLKNLKIVYTEFINPLKQVPRVLDMFQFDNSKTDVQEVEVLGDQEQTIEFLFEQYMKSEIYAALLQAAASEHSYRRNSTDAANRNSKELMEILKLEINRARQSAITQEISEIIGGSEASKKE